MLRVPSTHKANREIIGVVLMLTLVNSMNSDKQCDPQTLLLAAGKSSIDGTDQMNVSRPETDAVRGERAARQKQQYAREPIGGRIGLKHSVCLATHRIGGFGGLPGPPSAVKPPWPASSGHDFESASAKRSQQRPPGLVLQVPRDAKQTKTGSL